MSWPSLETLQRLQSRFRSRPWLWGMIALAGLGLVGMALALSAAPRGNRDNPLPAASLTLEVFVKLGIVLLLVYLSLYLLRRLQGVGQFTARRQISLLETVHLSPRQKLHLVRVGERTLLLGATDHSLSFLAEVDLPPAPAAQPMSAPTPRQGAAFTDLLTAWLAKR